MKTRKKAWEKGFYAERLCILVLILKGYKILAKRYKTRVGEIDIVALRWGTLVFVEVKARASKEAGLTALAPKQQRRIENAASLFLARSRKKRFKRTRFDVMVVMPWKWPVHLTNAWQTESRGI